MRTSKMSTVLYFSSWRMSLTGGEPQRLGTKDTNNTFATD